MAFGEPEDNALMGLSYAVSDGAYSLSASNLSTTVPTFDFAPVQRAAQRLVATVSSNAAPLVNPLLPLAVKPAERPMKIMARLIRYTVVDPDPILADKKPEACILLSGVVMLNGTDDRGFLMDLAPQVAAKLGEHNTMRGTVEYDDSEGRTKTLKPVRLGQLDTVLEMLKQYVSA